MKRLLSFLICLVALHLGAQNMLTADGLAAYKKKALGGGGGGTPVKIFFAHADGSAGNCTTSPGTNTAGSTLFIAATGGYRSPTPVQSDSKVNTWTGLTEEALGGGSAAKLWWVGSPLTDSAQTFSADGGDVGSTAYSSEATIGFSGVTTIDGSSAGGFLNASGSPPYSVQPGSRTPSQGGTVFFTAVRSNTGTTWTIDSGFTILWQGTNASGEAFATAYKIKGPSDVTAENPTWTTVTTGGLPDEVAVMSNFK